MLPRLMNQGLKIRAGGHDTRQGLLELFGTAFEIPRRLFHLASILLKTKDKTRIPRSDGEGGRTRRVATLSRCARSNMMTAAIAG